MGTYCIFVASAIIGWIGVIGFSYENITGRMNRYTRWSEMTNRQWLYCYMMVQFAAVIVVSILYHSFKSVA